MSPRNFRIADNKFGTRIGTYQLPQRGHPSSREESAVEG
jgi:hypothetical protein